MASQFVRKITDTTINEPIKETTTNGDLIITKDDKVLINLNGTLKDLTAGKDAEMPVVGGRNLYLNSKTNLYGYSKFGNVTATVEPFDSTTNMWHIVASQGSGNQIGIYTYKYGIKPIPDKSDWSYSADIKGTGKVVLFSIDGSTRSPVKGNIGSEWSRISQTGHVNGSNKPIIMYFDTTNIPLDVYIKLPKLERGNVSSDWTPAPEDIQSDIVTANTAIKKNADDIKTANTNIKKNTDDITQLKADIEALKPTE